MKSEELFSKDILREKETNLKNSQNEANFTFKGTREDNVDLFKELQQKQIDLAENSRGKRKDYQLKIFTGIIDRGCLRDLDNQLPFYLFLTPKTTKAVKDSSGQVWYLVYGGKHSEIIKEIKEYFKITKSAVSHHLRILEKKGYIATDSKTGQGTAIALRKIPGVYERKELDKKMALVWSTKSNPIEQLSKNTEQKSNDINQKFNNLKQLTNHITQRPEVHNEEIAIKNKGNSENGCLTEEVSGSYNDSIKEDSKETTTTGLDVVSSQIYEILNTAHKGSIKLSSVKDKIKGKDPEKMKAYAEFAAKKARTNAPGYWLKLVDEEPDTLPAEKDIYLRSLYDEL